MKLAIIGFGTEGQAAYRYWRALGAEITIHDAAADKELPEGVRGVLGPDYLKHLDGYDLVVRSPGVKPWEVRTSAPVTSVTREFMAKCPVPVIGVTGTKGKGTTSSLIARILEEAGRRVHIGGNIGVPPLDFLAEIKSGDAVVLELSSFQLMDADRSPHIAVCLMITREHMDWHRSMDEYVTAKGNIFQFQDSGDMAVYNAHNEQATGLAALSPGRRVPYLEAPGAQVQAGRIVIADMDICGVDEVGLVGPHNLENICAAVTATWELVRHEVEPVRRAIKAFTGLEHRLEFVREVKGVHYYDDSFATTPETTMAALASFPDPKVIILGGSEKRSDYSELARAIKHGNVRQAILIGETAPRIRAELERAGFSDFSMGPAIMSEIVELASGVARPGDVVLLSPGCASFGLFKNYKVRGDQFQQAVAALR